METKIYRAGELAYYDTFSGLIPCKVIEVILWGSGKTIQSGKVKIKLTADRQAYKRGEILEVTADNVIPRNHIRTSSGKYKINVYYEWKC